MPVFKRSRSAIEPASEASTTLNLPPGSDSAQDTSSATEERPSPSKIQRLIGFFSSLTPSPSKKRRRTNSTLPHSISDSSASLDCALQERAASGFVELSSEGKGMAPAVLPADQEGALRYPSLDEIEAHIAPSKKGHGSSTSANGDRSLYPALPAANPDSQGFGIQSAASEVIAAPPEESLSAEASQSLIDLLDRDPILPDQEDTTGPDRSASVALLAKAREKVDREMAELARDAPSDGGQPAKGKAKATEAEIAAAELEGPSDRDVDEIEALVASRRGEALDDIGGTDADAPLQPQPPSPDSAVDPEDVELAARIKEPPNGSEVLSAEHADVEGQDDQSANTESAEQLATGVESTSSKEAADLAQSPQLDLTHHVQEAEPRDEGAGQPTEDEHAGASALVELVNGPSELGVAPADRTTGDGDDVDMTEVNSDRAAAPVTPLVASVFDGDNSGAVEAPGAEFAGEGLGAGVGVEQSEEGDAAVAEDESLDRARSDQDTSTTREDVASEGTEHAEEHDEELEQQADSDSESTSSSSSSSSNVEDTPEVTEESHGANESGESDEEEEIILVRGDSAPRALASPAAEPASPSASSDASEDSDISDASSALPATSLKPLPAGAVVVDLTAEDDSREEPTPPTSVGFSPESALGLGASLRDRALASSSGNAEARRRPRHSALVGPMTMEAMQKDRDPCFTFGSPDRSQGHPTYRSSNDDQEDDDTYSERSAIDSIRDLGRGLQNMNFLKAGRSKKMSLGSGFARGPSSVASSSLGSYAAGKPKTRSSSYTKKNHILAAEHKMSVAISRKLDLKRAVQKALARINSARTRRNVPILDFEAVSQMTQKGAKVQMFLQTERVRLLKNQQQQLPSLPSLDDNFQSFLERIQQRESDATSTMPLPPHKLTEIDRLKREQRERARRLRGVLGRKPLPDRLSDEAEAEVDAVFRRPGKIASIPGAQVDDKDVRKLKPGQWLNDEVINFYGNLFLARSADAEKKRQEGIEKAKKLPPPPLAVEEDAVVGSDGTARRKQKNKEERPYDPALDAYWRIHFFSSFFWENLRNRGFDGVKRWTRKVDIFSKDLVLFPINLGNSHWVCGAINFRERRFEYYDSMGLSNPAAFQLMRSYVKAEGRDKKKKTIDLRGWRNRFSRETPQQENGYDCGVFACMTLEQISRRDPRRRIPDPVPVKWLSEGEDAESSEDEHDSEDDGDEEHGEEDEYEWNFRQRNMPYLRRRMAYEIAKCQLLD